MKRLRESAKSEIKTDDGYFASNTKDGGAPAPQDVDDEGEGP
jgi:hypothetical protein